MWRDISLTNEISTLKGLSRLVSNIAVLLNNRQMNEFAKMMEEIGFALPTLKDLDRLDLPPSKRDRLSHYIKEIENENDMRAVVLTLLTLSKVDKDLPIEICWTGPSKDSHIRMTWPALSEIILDAEKSISIVGYSITPNMERVMDYLEQKSKEGVKLVFMIDRVKEKSDFLQWLKRLDSPFEVYGRPQDKDDPMSALHVKCIVVDEEVAMFGSANLTYHGMKGNIELGLIIKDNKIVKKIECLLTGLKEELVEIDLGAI